MRHRYRTPAEKDESIRLAVEQMNKPEWAGSGNYVADDDTNPTKVTFANGRTVEIVDGHLAVGRVEREQCWCGERPVAMRCADCGDWWCEQCYYKNCQPTDGSLSCAQARMR